MNASRPRFGKYLILASFVIVSIATTAAADSLWHEWRIVNTPLHAGLEALGGLSAVIIGLFLLERGEEARGVRRLPLAAGFLGMGILDVFHAITPPGQAFVLLHSAASLVGGSCFALVWLPGRRSGRQQTHRRWVPGAVAVGATLFGVWALASPHILPVMLAGEEFTSTAVTLNVLAGGLFLGAAARLLVDFHQSGRLEAYLLACMATMFGLAGVLFNYSALWDHAWWQWHLLRTTGDGLALAFAFREYSKAVGDLRIVLAEHQTAEARLRDGEILYRTLFEQSPDGILVMDARTTLPIAFNDTAASQLGYSRDEFARLRVSDYEVAETTEQTARHVEKVLNAGHDSFETRHRTKQGSVRTVLVTVRKITLSGQAALHCIFQDVTQLHEQAALARLGEMAAVVAHEVKNPLAGVRGAIQVIGQRLAPGSQDTGVSGEIIVRERIFTPFFTTKTRGSDLGLPTAKRLIEAHRGQLRVACPPAGGTIVTIELPL